jgi:hypothetical protein
MRNRGSEVWMNSNKFRTLIPPSGLLWVWFLLLPSPSWARKSRAVILQTPGQAAVPHREEQTPQSNCTIRRDWFEIEGSPQREAAQRVNATIRGLVNAGKKIGPEDCPKSGSAENWEYLFSAKISGQWKKQLGFQWAFHFSGDPERHQLNCLTFDLENGNQVFLKSYLTSAGRKKIADQLCAQAKMRPKELSDPSYDCGTGKKSAVADALFCLTDTGVKTIAPSKGDWKTTGPEINIAAKDLHLFFSLPTNLKP